MELKVVTINVWNGGKLFDEIVAFLRAQDADLVLVQEACNGRDSYQDEPRLMQFVVLETPSGAVQVCNLRGAWNLDGDAYSLQRQRMADAVINATKANHVLSWQVIPILARQITQSGERELKLTS